MACRMQGQSVFYNRSDCHRSGLYWTLPREYHPAATLINVLLPGRSHKLVPRQIQSPLTQEKKSPAKKMPEDIVTVFGASGRQGLAQVRQLVARGYRVKAVTRGPDRYTAQDLTGVTAVFADYNDASSLARACAGSRGVFFTHPMFEDALHVNSHIERVAAATKEAGVA